MNDRDQDTDDHLHLVHLQRRKSIVVVKRSRLDDLRSTIRDRMILTMFEAVDTSSLSLPYQVTIYSGVLVAVLLVWKGLQLLRGARYTPVPVDSRKTHLWHHIDIISHSVYCSVCEGIVVDGFFCGSCGVCSDAGLCQKAANTQLPCKVVSLPSLKPKMVGDDCVRFSHHWIRGNLPIGSTCTVCEEEIVDTGKLLDFRCCWCQRTVHEDLCYGDVKSSNCDFGPWASMILPPYAIRVKRIWSRGQRQLIVESLNDFNPRPDWTPLIVITNRKSGDNEGDKILRHFRLILNPAQVIDLEITGIESALEWCRLLSQSFPDTRVRVMVAGGDGSVGWVLDTIDKLKLDPKPEVGIMPLGTGNDLSRVLGWGELFSCDTPVVDVMNKIRKATSVPIDRWKVSVSPLRLFPRRIMNRQVFMNNYFSVGVDAHVALNFHETRSSALYKWLGNRIVNKFLYFTFGTKDFLEGRKCSCLNERIVLEMDGVQVTLPELESIVVLNIPSWGGGANLWNLNLDSDRKDSEGSIWPVQKFNDEKLEVIGLYSTFHIGQLMIGLSEPLRLGQASRVKIRLLESLAIQVDGEPWLQYPSVIDVTFHGKASMLTTS